MTTTRAPYTRALGEYLASSQAANVPADLCELIKLLTLDSIGCGLLGSQLPWTRVLRETLSATESPGPALSWGSSARYSAANAAMVNGTAVHGFELDDVGPGSHFGSVTTSVGLALGDAMGAVSGRALILATIAGIEVAARIADGLGREPLAVCGFHGPGLFGSFAAMGTGASLLHLNTVQSIHAIGNAAQFTGGIMGTHHGGMGKRLLAGKAAHSGTLAAQLADHGFTNVDNILECGFGSFPWAFSGGRENYDLAQVTAGLGDSFRSYGLTFKMWACRMPIHPFLEALRALRAARDIRPDEIERISIALPQGTYRAVGFPYEPTSVTSAQLNLQFCLAIMLIEGDVFLEQFTEENVRSPRVLDLISRIDIHYDPAMDSAPTVLTKNGTILAVALLDIRLKSGETILQRGSVRGVAGEPIGYSDVVEKFRKTSAAVLSGAQQDEVIELCAKLETLPDTRVITNVIAKA